MGRVSCCCKPGSPLAYAGPGPPESNASDENDSRVLDVDGRPNCESAVPIEPEGVTPPPPPANAVPYVDERGKPPVESYVDERGMWPGCPVQPYGVPDSLDPWWRCWWCACLGWSNPDDEEDEGTCEWCRYESLSELPSDEPLPPASRGEGAASEVRCCGCVDDLAESGSDPGWLLKG